MRIEARFPRCRLSSLEDGLRKLVWLLILAASAGSCFAQQPAPGPAPQPARPQQPAEPQQPARPQQQSQPQDAAHPAQTASVAEPEKPDASSAKPQTPQQKQLAEDTAKLLQLANELKTEMDKSTKDTLSLTVIKKADEVEKLARKVREEMKADLDN